MHIIGRVDRQLFKYSPDQMIVRLNDVIDTLNNKQVTVMVEDAKSNEVIMIGLQPDGSFGIKKWNKQGDNYTYISGVM